MLALIYSHIRMLSLQSWLDSFLSLSRTTRIFQRPQVHAPELVLPFCRIWRSHSTPVRPSRHLSSPTGSESYPFAPLRSLSCLPRERQIHLRPRCRYWSDMESVHHGVWSCGIVGIIQLFGPMESTDEHNFRFTAFLCLLAGITCIMAQILVYIFLQESQAVKITMT